MIKKHWYEISLYYFEKYNQAEPHSMILNYANVSLKDIRVEDKKTWANLRPTMPNRVIPALRFS